ncbi:pyridoxal phosphate phosphatase PHOSPHO2-like [Babylonia areolata]|uniref:pyridoxal phosphate phosphatase PHOSPHO2-like n=1 Tax=Babylonia areolata TaxID=304850 RepID=UPI003FD08310
MAHEERNRILLALDFDHTLIDANADLSLCKLAPGGTIPDEIQSLYSNNGWVNYMGAVFRHLHKHGVTAKDIQKHVEALPLVPGVSELFEYFRNFGHCDVIIISDSNSVLIDTWLKHHTLDSLVSQVFTNPAEFDVDGCLKVGNYHIQNWCSISTINLCKGTILQQYIHGQKMEGKFYSHVLYVGDGAKDFCPALMLSKEDYVCPRKDFPLWKKLHGGWSGKKPSENVSASVIGWESAVEIRTLLEKLHSGKV